MKRQEVSERKAHNDETEAGELLPLNFHKSALDKNGGGVCILLRFYRSASFSCKNCPV